MSCKAWTGIQRQRGKVVPVTLRTGTLPKTGREQENLGFMRVCGVLFPCSRCSRQKNSRAELLRRAVPLMVLRFAYVCG